MSLGPGARRLIVYRNQKVVVACERCGLSRRYDGNRMIAKLGPDVVLPDLLRRIAKAEGCDLINAPTPNGLRCGLRYG
ncbi:RNase P subunit RPR2 [Rhizobium rosettiformans]|uniref:RNase P subunit RPR2 n=1 Tax=Rhizobium rosettiformans TaxID=1368430 RepID=A0A7W8HMQ7_9HYPH|nr:RNase P subunit RPR2 [Rhizobium rosettiformans]